MIKGMIINALFVSSVVNLSHKLILSIMSDKNLRHFCKDEVTSSQNDHAEFRAGKPSPYKIRTTINSVTYLAQQNLIKL